jgi:hypothetical protein
MAGHSVGDKRARQRFIARSIWFTVPATYLLLGTAYAILPPLEGLEETSARRLLAVRWLLVAVIPYAAGCIAIASARFFERAHNPLLGGESDRLKIQCRVMQNTLEQLVWFAVCVVPLATYLAPAQARLVPIVCILRRRSFRVLVGIFEERHTWTGPRRTAHILAEHPISRACVRAVRKTPRLVTKSTHGK